MGAAKTDKGIKAVDFVFHNAQETVFSSTIDSPVGYSITSGVLFVESPEGDLKRITFRIENRSLVISADQ